MFDQLLNNSYIILFVRIKKNINYIKLNNADLFKIYSVYKNNSRFQCYTMTTYQGYNNKQKPI